MKKSKMSRQLLVMAVAVLALAFASPAWAATVVNGGFELGDLSGWTKQSDGPADWFAYTVGERPAGYCLADVAAIPDPPQGNHAAVGTQEYVSSTVMYQDIALEPNAEHKLSFNVFYNGGNTAFSAPETLHRTERNQQYRIDIVKPSADPLSVEGGDILQMLFRTDQGDPNTLDPTKMTFDLSEYAGQTVRLRFAVVNTHGCLSAGADDVSIETTQADTTPPETSITSGPSGTVRSTSASFGFSASESDSSFECRRDGEFWEPCTSPYSYSSLGQGSHSFEVAATDLSGNRDATPSKRIWKVDTVAPRVTSVSPASGATGISPGANVFAKFSEAMRPSTIKGTTVKLVRKGTTTPVAATVTYDASLRRAKLDPSSSLRRRATYTATVTTGLKDFAGNPMASKKSWAFTVRP